MKLLKNILKTVSIQPVKRTLSEKDLIRKEAKIGGQLFGPVPKGHKREFFCLDKRTWVWYEEWRENGQLKQVTTRYEIQDNGILKTQGNQPYKYASPSEQRHLYNAIKLYYQYVMTYVYGVRTPA